MGQNAGKEGLRETGPELRVTWKNDDEYEDVYKGIYIFLQRSVRMRQLYTYIHTQRGEWREKEGRKYNPLYHSAT